MMIASAIANRGVRFRPPTMSPTESVTDRDHENDLSMEYRGGFREWLAARPMARAAGFAGGTLVIVAVVIGRLLGSPPGM